MFVSFLSPYLCCERPKAARGRQKDIRLGPEHSASNFLYTRQPDLIPKSSKSSKMFKFKTYEWLHQIGAEIEEISYQSSNLSWSNWNSKLKKQKENTINSLLFSTNQSPVWRKDLKPAVVEEAPKPMRTQKHSLARSQLSTFELSTLARCLLILWLQLHLILG